MIELDSTGTSKRDVWLDTDSFAININEYSDGSVRVEVIRGTHLGPSMGYIYVSVNASEGEAHSPRPPALRPVPEIETEPEVRPEQQRIVNAMDDAEINSTRVALMVNVTRESVYHWRKGRPINGPNLKRLREVADALKLEVPEC